jgi:hypothetical protein
MEELEKLIWYYIKIIIICKGLNPLRKSPKRHSDFIQMSLPSNGPRTDPKENAPAA